MKLFEKSAIADMELKNRIIRSATHEGLSDKEGFPLETLKELYVRLAKGGAGAIITGFAGVQTDGRISNRMRMFDDDKYIDKYKEILAAVKEHNTPVILQIAHGGGQLNRKSSGNGPVAPSKHKYELNSENARKLAEEEINIIIENFISAIERAKKCGFDGVQIHAAHGYLLSEFLSPSLNKRHDQWGGNTDNRFRIVKEIITRAKKKVGNFPILVKISAYDSNRNGMRINEAVKIAKLLEHCGCDAIEVSCGNDNAFLTIKPNKIPVDAIINFSPVYKNYSFLKKKILSIMINLKYKKDKKIENYNLYSAQKIKESVAIPVIVVGGIRKLNTANDIIENKKIDYISMSRPFIIEPDIVNKWISGKQENSLCINCDYCIIGVLSGTLKCYHGKVN
jgi:2,4-dienoyl-CoA reductase-like NADH-dependent reductase (Old Yellow Enzyme family)